MNRNAAPPDCPDCRGTGELYVRNDRSPWHVAGPDQLYDVVRCDSNCFDGVAGCVLCDLPAAAELDGEPMCRAHLDEHACSYCGERHPDEEHGIVMQERAEDAREAAREEAYGC